MISESGVDALITQLEELHPSAAAGLLIQQINNRKTKSMLVSRKRDPPSLHIQITGHVTSEIRGNVLWVSQVEIILVLRE